MSSIEGFYKPPKLFVVLAMSTTETLRVIFTREVATIS
jgi:hypothetical protein